jgi:hypothetical protein
LGIVLGENDTRETLPDKEQSMMRAMDFYIMISIILAAGGLFAAIGGNGSESVAGAIICAGGWLGCGIGAAIQVLIRVYPPARKPTEERPA